MSDPGVWGEDFVFKTYRRWDTSNVTPFCTPLKFNIDIYPKMTPYLKPEIHFPTIIFFVSIGVIDFLWGNWNIFQSESMEKSKKDLSFLFRGEFSNLGRENLSRFCPAESLISEMMNFFSRFCGRKKAYPKQDSVMSTLAARMWGKAGTLQYWRSSGRRVLPKKPRDRVWVGLLVLVVC